MNLKNRNIKSLFAVFVFAAFAISFTHSFMEQVETGCPQHDNHDFSTVIVNTVMTFNNVEKSPLGNCEFQFPLINDPALTVIQSDNLQFYNFIQTHTPFPEKIYLSKSGSLII